CWARPTARAPGRASRCATTGGSAGFRPRPGGPRDRAR
ncbi:MAG: hypothetical protein AVDCRST_MAG16-1460, partial [uncultured Frankineae bacterium]